MINVAEMIKDEFIRNGEAAIFGDIDFLEGDVYLFHTDNPDCPTGSSLWAVFDKCVGGKVYLESSTIDGFHFSVWHPLPEWYRYCRESTPDELKRYMSAFGRWEASRSSET